MSPKVDLISTDNFVGFINVLTLLIGELYLTGQLTYIKQQPHFSQSNRMDVQMCEGVFLLIKKDLIYR